MLEFALTHPTNNVFSLGKCYYNKCALSIMYHKNSSVSRFKFWNSFIIDQIREKKEIFYLKLNMATF